MEAEKWPLVGRFFGPSGVPENQDESPLTQNNPTPTNLQGELEGNKRPEDRGALIEKWRRLPRNIANYLASLPGVTPEYPAGQILIIGGEQVMDTFERPWCAATVEQMFDNMEGRGPLTVVERGFGLGIMSEYINNRMRSIGGKHIIIELNAEVSRDAKKWADSRNRENKAIRFAPKLDIEVVEGDADERLAEFQNNSIDLLFSDTHQLQPSELGINDLLKPQLIADKLKPDGKFTFCAFHRDNQFGIVEDRQRELIDMGFERFSVSRVEITVPPHSDYLKGPRKVLQVVVASGPKKANYPDWI